MGEKRQRERERNRDRERESERERKKKRMDVRNFMNQRERESLIFKIKNGQTSFIA